jgi:hypothetical protein
MRCNDRSRPTVPPGTPRPSSNPGLTTSLAAALALLAGCAVPQAQRPPEPADLPAQWSTPAADAMPGWAAPLDPALADLQARALQANRDIRLAMLRWRAAQDQLRLAELARAPQPSAGLNASTSLAMNAPLPAWRGQQGASASLAYEPDLWGRLAASVAASQAQADAAQRDIAVARLLIRSQVAEAWWQLGANRMQRALVGPQREAAVAVLEATRARVREGRLAARCSSRTCAWRSSMPTMRRPRRPLPCCWISPSCAWGPSRRCLKVPRPCPRWPTRPGSSSAGPTCSVPGWAWMRRWPGCR